MSGLAKRQGYGHEALFQNTGQLSTCRHCNGRAGNLFIWQIVWRRNLWSRNLQQEPASVFRLYWLPTIDQSVATEINNYSTWPITVWSGLLAI